METTTPTLSTIRLASGLAGQCEASLTVTYPGEAPKLVRFVGSFDDAPVVLITPNGQTVVARAVSERIGYPFHTNRRGWVTAFFS